MTDDALPIPGLDQPASRSVGDLERAVRRTLRALEEDGLIEERHAARLQLAIELAQIVSLKRATGKVSTVGNDARVLMELIDKLLPNESAVDDMLRDAMAKWSEVIAGDAAGDAAAEVLDPTEP